ncbi:hypothetical protein TrLO_g13241 [Triparma laevis f. longispina]|uniref:Tr-type G domain-containing protein n=1 Tax=Triparma laevis f. longispina TaxID=1714387 RepID=A0A9W7F9J0_9STRA|nr:hypothetical protein TrLO_g13241 [Triparma laevis f. longispina]
MRVLVAFLLLLSQAECFISSPGVFARSHALRSATLAPNSATTGGTVEDKIRNIAIIAHVDHGKTTLVDAMLQQSSVFRDQAQIDEAGVRVMDSNDQERERGITILAKNCAVMRDGIKINIIDTPGHADFGGEVERVLNMADGVLLVVDSVEGPKPQTRFVLDKALKRGMQCMVVVNKIDRPSARPDYVVDKTFDLFCELDATDEQTDFKTIYASAINGIAGDTPDGMADDMGPLFDAIIANIDPPHVESQEPEKLQALVANIDYDSFKGKLGVARLTAGAVKAGQAVALVQPGEAPKKGRIGELFIFDDLGKKQVDGAKAGEVIMFSGMPDVTIGDTLVTNEGGMEPAEPLPPIAVEQPTVRMTFGVNKSPLAGREGKFLTSRMIRDRLFKENVALKVEETDSADRYEVSGRGQLHLTVLVETMRREGFELEIGPPSVIVKEIDGKKHEPVEKVEVRVPEEYSGAVIDMFNNRKGELLNMGLDDGEGAFSVIEYRIPTRGMIGIRSALLTATRGTAIIDSLFDSYQPVAGEIGGNEKGSLLAFADGSANTFGIQGAQDRGNMFISPNDEVYKGMIVGVHQRPGDLEVNICKTKALTNMRSAGKDNYVGIVPPLELTLDGAVEYLSNDEILEVTPSKMRMAKNPDKWPAKKGKK